MADWRKTAKAILLADGGIDAREVAVLRKELLSGGKTDEAGLEFLLELRNSARSLNPAFHFLVIEALKGCLLQGDAIRPGAASLLRRWIFADGKVDFGEKRYLQELRAAAKQVPKDFDDFYNQCLAT
jgi:hypothetical protein